MVVLLLERAVVDVDVEAWFCGAALVVEEAAVEVAVLVPLVASGVRVVYPPIGPVKVGVAVTKTMVTFAGGC